MKAFISHGRRSPSLEKLEEFLRGLGVEPVTAKDGVGIEKAMKQADFVIILATGDDLSEGRRYAHQNVAREAGLAEKARPGKVIYLLEDSAVFPTSIDRGVWERFSGEDMESAFQRIKKKMKAVENINPPSSPFTKGGDKNFSLS